MPDPFITKSWKNPTVSETINSAARSAGRQYIKNRVLLASQKGSVVSCALKLVGSEWP